MTQNSNPAACGSSEIHPAHRYFDAADVSRPCAGRRHGDALAPGEIRTHTVGASTFQVMHVAGGSFTQATVRQAGVTTTTVLATKPLESFALKIYADAIEQAESDAADALDGEDEPMEPLTAEGEEALRVRAGFAPSLPTVPQDRTADGVPEVEQERRPLDLSLAIAECKRFEEIDRAAVARGESANWWERGTESEVEQADEPENAAHLLTIIRDNLRRYVPGGGEQYLDRYLAAVAGAVPQRATDADEYSKGDPLWLHECGGVMPGEGDRKPDECPRHWCIGGKWRALYTLGGE